MPVQYLNQLDIPMKDGLYLDCGVLFPFYFKDAYNLNTTRWIGDICTWLKHFKVKTTYQVLREAEYAYKKVPLSKTEKRRTLPLYNKILSTIDKVDVHIEKEDYKLSEADLSLLFRPDKSMTLLTADKALYYADKRVILLLWDTDLQQLSCQTDKVN